MGTASYKARMGFDDEKEEFNDCDDVVQSEYRTRTGRCLKNSLYHSSPKTKHRFGFSFFLATVSCISSRKGGYAIYVMVNVEIPGIRLTVSQLDQKAQLADGQSFQYLIC